jgi:predicted nucleotidyltransferase
MALSGWYNARVLVAYSFKGIGMMEKADRNNTATDRQLLAECKAAIREVAPEAGLILYGSRARGDAQEDSDYDLLVLVDREVDMDLERAIVDRLVPLEVRTGKVLTVLIYSRLQWDAAQYRAMPFHKNVTREGVPI